MGALEQQHTQDDPQRSLAPAMAATTTTVGPRPITFQQARLAFENKDAAVTEQVANNPAGVFALQQEARKGARAAWQAKREEFERKVAIRATKNPKVEDAVDQMVQKAVSFLLKMNADRQSQEAAIESLGASKYADSKPSYEEVAKKLKSGSIREKMMLLGKFHETVAEQMLAEGPEAMKKKMEAAAKAQAENAGDPAKASLKLEELTAERKDAEGNKVKPAEFGDKELGAYAARAAEHKADVAKLQAEGKKASVSVKAFTGTTLAEASGRHAAYAGAKSENHDTKLPQLSVAALAQTKLPSDVATPRDQGGGMTKGAEASSLVPSAKKVSQYAMDPALSEEENKYRLELSETEKAKVAEQAVPEEERTLPWIEGQKANILDAEKEFIKEAKEDSMPLKSGISGTTFRFMQSAEMLGVDPDAARMACVGMLQPIEAHSFHEIATAASGFGGKGGEYADRKAGEGAYSDKTMAPLSQEELAEVAADCGTTLEYLNNPPPFEPGEEPGAAAAGGGGAGAASPPAGNGDGKPAEAAA